MGGIAGYLATAATDTRHSLTGCKNYGTISGTSQVGGIAGQAVNFCNYEGCENYGTITGTKETSTYAGGIVGQGGTCNTLTECNNNAAVTGVQYAGGIVGSISDTGKFLNCKNNGDITGATIATEPIINTYVGGIAGYIDGGLTPTTIVTVENCENTGAIAGVAQTGGIAGYSEYAIITGCTNEGSISGTSQVGGIAGYVRQSNNTSGIINAVSAGPVSATGDYVGGIIGDAFIASIQWSVVTGNVSGQNYVGGLIGRSTNPNFYMQDSYVLSDIHGENYIGGLGGLVASNKSKNCFYYNTGAGVTGRQNVSMPYSGLTSAANFYYLSDTDSNGSAKTAEEFEKNAVLNLLQKNATPYADNNWGQGESFPEIMGTPQSSIYRVGLTNRLQGESEVNAKNSVKFSESGNNAYTVYGTTGAEYTCVPGNTELILNVTLSEGFNVTFYPADAVKVTEVAAQDEDESAQYTYSIAVGSEDVDVEYLFSTTVEADDSWYNTEDSEFTITTEAQLRDLAARVNGGNTFEGKKISIGKDIELTGGLFTPIGIDVSHPFNGTFDGCDHTISGLAASYAMGGTSLTYTALFGYAEASSVIENLTVRGMVDGWQYSAGVVAYNKGKISNVTSGVSVSTFWSLNVMYYAGGIAGYSTGTITDCTNEGALTAVDSKSAGTGTYGYFGGIVGCSTGPVSGSVNNGTVTGEWSLNVFAGGIVGQGTGAVITESLNTGKVYFVDLLVADSTYKQLSVGGIVGNGAAMIKQCENSGSIYGYNATAASTNGGVKVGGISGTGANMILESVNTGSVYGSGSSYVRAGGIAGNSTGTIENSYNLGSVRSTGNTYLYAGGITGYSTGTIENSYNLGSVQLTGNTSLYAGGLIGQYYPSSNAGALNVAVINSYNAGTVEAPTGSTSVYVGAVTGYDKYSTYPVYYYNAYYLDSLGLLAVNNLNKDGITSRSDEEMRGASFAGELGMAFSAAADRYPKLHWEDNTPVGDDNVIFSYNQSSFYDLGYANGVVTYKESDTSINVALNEDGTVTKPADPSKENFIFLGWYEDPDDPDAEPFDFTIAVSQGTTLYAKWKLVECTATFHYNGYTDEDGNGEKKVTVELKGTVSSLPMEREGYELVGWFLKDAGGNFEDVPYDFTQKLPGDIDLYARWQEVTSDYSWYDPEDDDLYISTVGELFAFARLVNGEAPESVADGPVDFAGVTVHLADNIDMAGYLWSRPIGAVADTPFKGTFDGNNKKISGINIVGYSYLGLFGYLESAKIKDLTVAGSIHGYSYVGAVAAYASNTVFENVMNQVDINGISYIGGIVGYGKSNLTFNQCINEGSVVASGSHIGGIVGHYEDNATFTGCKNYAAVTAVNASYVGGIAGFASYSADAAAFTETVNYGDISGTNQVGGIVGYITLNNATYTDDKKLSLSECSNFGTISTSGSYVGGIVGYGYSNLSKYMHLTFTDCGNTGAIQGGDQNAGGITGSTGGKVTSDFITCINSGTVMAASAGGIAGYVLSSTDTAYSSITDCENTGDITATTGSAGGIVSGCGSYIRLSNLSNSGSISAGSLAGGIAGSFGSQGSYSNLTNSGSVSGGTDAGGIAANGGTSDFKFEHLYNSGDVSGTTYVGGIAGSLSVYNNITIQDCSNTGTVILGSTATATITRVGGLFGMLSSNKGDIKTCYNTGDVTAEGNAGYVGGLVGFSNDDSTTSFSIISCYNAGDITANSAASAYVGGILGHHKNNYPIENTHNVGIISGIAPDKLGAISGDSGNGSVSDSYYLENCVVIAGAPVTPADSAYASSMSDAAFQSGELSYLLDSGDTATRRNLWSQAEYPVFADEDNHLVYKASASVDGVGTVSYHTSSSDEYWYIKAGETANVDIAAGGGNVLHLISAKDTTGKVVGSASEATLGTDKVFTFTMPADNVLISAAFIPQVTASHTVTFISEGTTYKTATIDPGDAAVLPEAPTKASSGEDDYVFAGWYTDEACTNLYDFNTIVAEDITLYAKFKVAGLADVSFDLNYTGATGTPENQQVKQGKLLTEPTDPTRPSDYADGTEIVSYTFLGWYTASGDNGAKWDFASDVVPADVGDTMTLYAHWKSADALKADHVEISGPSALERLAENVRNGEDYGSTTFTLGADIVLENSWQGIGTAQHPFNGTFDGNGKTITITGIKSANGINTEAIIAAQFSVFHTIGEDGVVENLKVGGTLQNIFFGGITNVNRGTIRSCQVNLAAAMSYDNTTTGSLPKVGGVARLNYGTIEDCDAMVDFTFRTSGVGGFAAYNYGTISGCHLLPGSQITVYETYGGICGWNAGHISNCRIGNEAGDSTLQGLVLIGTNTTGGGIVGSNDGGTIVGCTNYAALIGGQGTLGVQPADTIGGIAGKADSGTITDCENYGPLLHVKSKAGGIAGDLGGTVSRCNNYVDVSGTDSGEGGKIGGIVGNMTGSIDDCTNRGKVSGGGNIGGIVGTASGSGKISGCANTGNVSASQNSAGGIVGNTSRPAIDRCSTTGDVSGILNVGGVVGITRGGSKISNCYSTGGVSGSLYMGGIVGFNSSTEGIKNCLYYNTNSTYAPISGGNGASAEAWSKCYYLDGTNSSGSVTGTGLPAAAFTSGEAAYLLDVYEGETTHNNIWTQGDTHPVFGAPSYYQVKVSVAGETGYGSAGISKEGSAAYQTASLYMPLGSLVNYRAAVNANKTVKTDPVTGAVTTTSYSLSSITLKHADGSSDEDFTDKGLTSSFILSRDVELVVNIVKNEKTTRPGTGSGTGNGIGNGTGDGTGSGTGNGTGNAGYGIGSESAGIIIGSMESIDMPGSSESGGGSQQGEPLPDEQLKSPVEKSPSTIYEVQQQVAQALKNPFVLALVIICIGVILFFSIFFRYKRSKRD